MDIIFEKFNSIYSFLNYINSKEPVKESRNSSQKTTNFDFFNSNSYEESVTTMEQGYKVKFEEFSKKLKEFQNNIEKKASMSIDVAGCVPIVARAIAGNPRAMYRIQREENKKQSVKIFYNGITDYTFTAKEIEENNLKLLKIITLLENNNIMVELWNSPYWSYRNNKNKITTCGCMVKLKDSNASLNLNKILYPLIHASFFRRQGFKFMEIHKLPLRFYSGYGCSMNASNKDVKLIKEEFKKSILKDYVCIDLEFLNSSNKIEELAKKIINS